jgi:ABC-type transport system involved in multi-copper enzyme maturation permease subunit|tara:strand:+ start:1219 stop:1602 length:384 start_codon:yes stop_codon:yes gene_type:complete
MALKAALIITGIAILLLIVYGADVAVSMGNEAKEGFLPLNEMQRGIGLGGTALILPIIAFFISLKEPSKGLGVMIIIAGILIIIGGIVVIANPSPEGMDRDPIGSAVMLFAPAAIQLGLGAIKIKKS